MLAVAALAAGALLTTGVAGASKTISSYPRAQTLYTSGTQYGPPSSWNPLQPCCYATGTLGLVYETLFLYDPLKDQFKPWLASSGSWTNADTYTIKLRPGIKWSDGKPLTADDVVYTLNLGKLKTVPYANIWNFISGVSKVNSTTVKVSFSTPNYQEWANWLYSWPILPEHLWQGRSEKTVVTGANPNPVGTGPYLYSTHDQQKQVWVRNPHWWATKALGLSVKPQYIVDVVNGSNNVMLGQVLQGNIDLSNNFLPGISSLVSGLGGYGLQTYFPQAPYMLPANTAWLVMNTTKAPMNDARFRRALAFAMDVPDVVKTDYGNIVSPASSSGLLPNWSKYDSASTLKQLGFSYNPAKAAAMLAAAGYKKGSDGYFKTPSGATIDLKLIVPNGWTDWMEAIQILATGAKAAGIKITPSYPDYNSLVAQRSAGKFDLLINNDKQLANTPWLYYDYIFHLPIQSQQTTVNYGRFSSSTAWALVQKLDKTPTTDVGGMKSVIAKLQKIQLSQMPIIPLWYNGAWAQYNNSVWTNWPCSASTCNHYLPVSWRGYWNMSSILMLTQLKPAPSK